MSTYNGQAYLSGQLDSIGTQTYKNWELWVSDDGSIDNTLQILKDYQNRMGEHRFFIYSGPRKGFSANFLSLICTKNSDADYYAYSDQDDIWAPDKLQQAINWLKTISKEIPALYCARTKLVNKHGKGIGSSPLFKKNPSFLNALVQNVAGGNTMVFNRAALNLLRTAGDKINVVAYDWWTYLLVAGAGGVILYDPLPSLYYRQHENNLIGSNVGWRARYRRISMLFKGSFKRWNDININALLSVQHLLAEDNRSVLNQYIEARESGLFFRLRAIQQLGIYRQTFLGNIGLITAALFNKI